MKIIFLGKYNQSEILTGPEKVAKRIFHEMLRNNSSCLFIEYFFKKERRSNVWVRLFGKEIVTQDGSVIRLGIIRIILFLLVYQPDVIHVMTLERFMIPIFLLRFVLKGKIFVTVHGIMRYEQRITNNKESFYSSFKDKLLEALMLRYSSTLIFVSQPQLSLMRQYYTVNFEKVQIIPNGIDECFSKSQPKSFSPSTLNIVVQEREILGASNTEALVEILALCNNCSLSLYIVGGRSQNEYAGGCLKVFYIHKMPTEDFSDFLADKDIVINNAMYETFSLMTVECMAAGLVPIVADTVGMKSFIKNGVNGFVYSANKPETIREIIEGIGSGNYDFQMLSENARKIYNELKWSNIARKYQEVYLK